LKKPQPEPTHIDDLNDLYLISQIITQSSAIRPAMDRIIQIIRPLFIFDNLVLYRYDPIEKSLEAVYARSTGRGRSAGADIAWGEAVAYQTIRSKQYTYQEPEENEAENRLSQAHILAVPLILSRKLMGVLIFIRFGGPKFVSDSIEFATYLGNQIVWLLGQYDFQLRAQALGEQHKVIQLQEDFVNTITHELRNPLGFIKGYTTTLLRQDAKWKLETQREFLQIIDQETDQLSELIENMLDSARIQSGQLSMDFHPIQVNALLNDVIQKFSLHHPDVKIFTQLDPDIPTISGDARRLAQVFDNLLSNAYKYAPNSKIDVISKKDSDTVQIQVRDYGPGIAENYLPHIFERFFRVPEQSISIRGTGLGLHICKQLMEAHHGRITASSKIGKGTTFSVILGVNLDVTPMQNDKEVQ
jgi:signal transduction histidine kinase